MSERVKRVKRWCHHWLNSQIWDKMTRSHVIRKESRLCKFRSKLKIQNRNTPTSEQSSRLVYSITSSDQRVTQHTETKVHFLPICFLLTQTFLVRNSFEYNQETFETIGLQHFWRLINIVQTTFSSKKKINLNKRMEVYKIWRILLPIRKYLDRSTYLYVFPSYLPSSHLQRGNGRRGRLSLWSHGKDQRSNFRRGSYQWESWPFVRGKLSTKAKWILLIFNLIYSEWISMEMVWSHLMSFWRLAWEMNTLPDQLSNLVLLWFKNYLLKYHHRFLSYIHIRILVFRFCAKPLSPNTYWLW